MTNVKIIKSGINHPKFELFIKDKWFHFYKAQFDCLLANDKMSQKTYDKQIKILIKNTLNNLDISK